MVLLGVVPLADALADVLLVALHRHIIQRGFRLEVADTEINTTVLEAVAQHGDKAVVLHGILKCFVEFLFGVAVALLLQSLPRHRLRSFYKGCQRTDIQRHAGGRRSAVACV